MKAPKISLDSKQLQALLLQHVEKIVLVVVVGLVVYFVYQGYILEGLPDGQTPDRLLAEANSTITKINNPSVWTEVSKEPERQVDKRVIEKVEEFRKHTDPSRYPVANSISRPDFPRLSPRVDPKIFAPLHVKVVGMVGPLAVYGDGTEADPLTAEKVESSPAGTRPPVARPPGPPRPPPPTKGKKKGEGADLLGGGPAPPPILGGSDFAQPGMPARGGVNPESIRGFDTPDASTIAHDVSAMVISAVVPSEKQFEEFEASLASSLDYDPVRDSPLYLQFAVERADVTANPAADPATLAWIKLNVPGALAETEKWAGALAEIVDPAYLHEKLTHPAPPFMQRDIWELLTHPDVPLATYDAGPSNPATSPAAPKTPDDSPGIDLPMPTPGGSSPFPGSGPTRPGSSFGGDGGGPSARPIRGPRTGPPPTDTGANLFGPAAAPLVKPKYQFIRFTDTTVERGKQYRYRVRVFLHDPNHPATGFTPPTIVSLREDVRTRVKDLDTADAKRGGGFRTYWVMSDWSEPSEPATLPPTSHYFAGKVTQPAATSIIEGRPKVAASQPQAKAVAVIWDRTKVVDVAAETDVYRGSTLDFTSDVQVIHPVTHQIIDLAKYPFRTRAMIVDMQGGEKIPPISKKNDTPLESPGELLIFDAAGNLHVCNEARDVEGYRIYLVPKPEAKKPAPGNNPGGGFDGLFDQPPAPPPRRGGSG